MNYTEFVKGITDGTITSETPYVYLPNDTFVPLSEYNLLQVATYRIMPFRWGKKEVPLITKGEVNDFTFTILAGTYTHVSYSRVAFSGPMRFSMRQGDLGVYPLPLIDVLGLQERALNPFRYHSYHSSNMRTNVGGSTTFHRLPTEDRTNPSFTYLGLELEVCGSDYIDKIHRIFCPRSNKDIFDHFDVSEDGSIRGYGLELVSLPMSRGYMEENRPLFKKLYNLLNENRLMGEGSSMHIHFDHRLLTSLDRSTLAALTRCFRGAYSSGSEIDIIAGRYPTTYCQLNRELCNPRESRPRDHHSWVSYDNRTFEIRIYGANLNEDDLFNKIDFTLAAINLATKLQDSGSIRSVAQKDIVKTQFALLIDQYCLNKLKIQKDVLLSTRGEIDFSDVYFLWTDDVAHIDELIKNKETSVRNLTTTLVRMVTGGDDNVVTVEVRPNSSLNNIHSLVHEPDDDTDSVSAVSMARANVPLDF